ncbi:secondary thiamine-phosphate synthase enzyme YjbQ [Geotoga petraea]|jgi:secondary thiamine-phosphate synthase enzyme|uniref:YjbQ family protein n=1 Tax=Geotoga petraea TaxID=28234 RepID=A0A4Z0W0B4_9BACT|nr:secondary thiamine-phosphate synthase enzyme YjbQ [Geotoga petraea]TGG87478.1 YjbQ family protein [Geotoga petraea]
MVIKKSIKTNSRNELLDITREIQGEISKENIQSGTVVVFVPHTTAAVTINENADPDVKKDILKFMQDKVPNNYGFDHIEGNSDSHIKSSVFGPSITLIIENGKLLLGTWQSVYFCEFDGPRNRKYFVKITQD